jgi:DNA-binding NtrC family response regulator
VRQLENMVKRFVILGSEEALSSELISRSQSSLSSVKSDEGTTPLKKLTQEAVGELERRVILKALQANHWNRKLAARDLKISYRALLYKIKQAGLPSKRKPSQPSTVPGLEM